MNVNKTPMRPIQFINRVFRSKIQDRKFHDEELISFSLLSYPISDDDENAINGECNT